MTLYTNYWTDAKGRYWVSDQPFTDINDAVLDAASPPEGWMHEFTTVLHERPQMPAGWIPVMFDQDTIIRLIEETNRERDAERADELAMSKPEHLQVL